MNWRADAKRALRAYPKLIRKKTDYINVSVTANYSGLPGAHNASRTTENAALKSGLTDYEERIIRAVENAMQMQSCYGNADARAKFAELVYFRRTHTLYGAACALEYSEDAVKRWNTELLTAVYVGMLKTT